MIILYNRDKSITEGMLTMNDQKMKGLIVEVYRNESFCDCTNGGISSKHDRFLLVGEGVAEVEESDNLPVLKLVKRIIGGEVYKHVQPLTEGKEWFMFGGNFVYSSDSRFPNAYPLKIHDRLE